MRYKVKTAAGPLKGQVRVPGDKSISHRAVLFSAIAQGVSAHTGVSDSADVRSTIGAVHALGAGVVVTERGDGLLDVTVSGWGSSGPTEPEAPVDCGNSGTTARLLMGVLAGWPVFVTLTGDESLSRRPMSRVTVPLSEMGAEIATAPGGKLPVRLFGRELTAIDYESSIASAQVKTAVLLAGLRARGRTVVTEPELSRDHTERMLPAFGVQVGRDDELPVCWVDGPVLPQAHGVDVPADPSSAAFPLCAAAIVPGSEVTCTDMLLNPTRIGFVRVLARMGADVTAEVQRYDGAEPVGRVTVAHRDELRGTLIGEEEVPSLVDEVPILAVVAARAEGTTRFEGVGELRVKESDRLQAVVDGLASLGVTVRSGPDWLEVDGPADMRSADLDSHGDHRLAMSFAVAGLVAEGGSSVDGFESVEVSYPGFPENMGSLGMEGASS